MKKIFAITFIITQLNCYSQNCKTIKDAFSDEKIITMDLYDGGTIIEAKKESIIFKLKINFRGEQNSIIKIGTEMSYKLESGDIIKLITFKDASPQSQLYGAEIYTAYSLIFQITKEDLIKMSKSKVTNIRQPDTNGGHNDFEYNTSKDKKYIKKLMEGIQCILNSLEQ